MCQAQSLRLCYAFFSQKVSRLETTRIYNGKTMPNYLEISSKNYTLFERLLVYLPLMDFTPQV